MAWIELVPVEEADEELAEAFAAIGIKQGTGGPPFEVLTQNGAVLAAFWTWAGGNRFEFPTLDRQRVEMIATLTSALNHCVF